MSVYDKELIIDGKAVRSPEQQVYKNMKDIKVLQEIIKPEYTTEEELTDASVSVAIADTNAPEGTTEGWLLTHDGLKFKITGGDETNLLLEFYADLKGPQGPEGITAIDDDTTALDSTWSSSKISNGVDKGSYITKTAPTLVTGTMYTLDVSNIFNKNDNVDIKKNDLIIYLNDGLVDSVYTVLFDVTDSTITLIKEGTFGGGKEYIHNIRAFGTSSGSYGQVRITITIINDSNTPFTYSTLREYLYNKGFTTNAKIYTDIRGYAYNTTNYYVSLGLFVAGLTSNIECYSVYQNSYTSVKLREDAIDTFDDFVSEK